MIQQQPARPFPLSLFSRTTSNFARAVFGALILAPALAFAATIDVSIIDSDFIPNIQTIGPGDTVRWTNNGGTHTVTSDDDLFDSSEIGNGAVFSYTFPTTPGRYRYFCSIHGGPGGSGMSGLIRVVDPANNHPPATPANTSPANGAANQSISPTLAASAFADEDDGDLHFASQWIIRDVAANTVVLDTGTDRAHLTSLGLEGLENARTYGWKVRYRDDIGAWSEYSTESQFTTVAGVTVQGTGLTASYAKYNVKKDISTVVLTTVDPTVNFNWKAGKPNKATPANNFFVRWEGTVLPQFSESYRFRVIADGGVRLWVKNNLVIDDWVKTPFAVYRNHLVELEAGVSAPIKLEYYDTLGNASIQLLWSSPSLPTEIIPQVSLFPVEAQ